MITIIFNLLLVVNANDNIQSNLTQENISEDNIDNTTTSIQIHEISKDNTLNNIKKEESIDTEQNLNNIYLTNDNYEEYMDYDYEANTNIIIQESLENLFLELYAENITISGINNATLKNSLIHIAEGDNTKITNLTFYSDDDSEYLNSIFIDTSYNIIDNVTFIDNRTKFIDDPDKYYAIDLTGNYNQLINSKFNSTYPAMNIFWDTYYAETKAAPISLHGDFNKVLNNSINVTESEYEIPFGTILGINGRGNNNTISNNTLNMNGNLYHYAITLFYHNNTVTDNIISVISGRYAAGITLDADASNNTVDNNTIYLQTSTNYTDGYNITDVSYGIVINEIAYKGGEYNISSNTTTTTNNIINANTIITNSTHTYAIEQYGSQRTNITNNKIKSYGKLPHGIAVIGSEVTVTGNDIEVYGETLEDGFSADYIKPKSTAIELQLGHDNIVTGNNIKAVGGTGTILNGEKNSQIGSNTYEIINGNTISTRGNSIDNVVTGNIFGSGDTIVVSPNNTYENNIFPSDEQPIPEEYQNITKEGNKTVLQNETANQTTTDGDVLEGGDVNVIIPENETSTNTTNQTNQTEPEAQPQEEPPEEPEIVENNTDMNNTDIINDTKEITQPIIEEENKTEEPEQQPEEPEEENKTIVQDLNMTEINNTVIQNDTEDIKNARQSNNTTTQVNPDEPSDEPAPTIDDMDIQEQVKDNNKQTTDENTINKNNHETPTASSTAATIAKVYEVTPKYMEDTLKIETLLPALIFMVILFASLIIGYRRFDNY